MTISIVGAGLAGSECAYQLAEMGHKVVLYEMRVKSKPESFTPAHKSADFAELVCSNSFGSMTDYSAPGQLKWEASQMGSLILEASMKASVPAGMALGVDRKIFAEFITQAVLSHPNIEVKRERVIDLSSIPRPTVIATGPLTDSALAKSIHEHFNNEFLYFFDAIAPIIDADSINMDIAYLGNRFDLENGDYINCPLTKNEYYAFINEVKKARVIEAKNFEHPTDDTPYFDGCMPIEEIVRRGDETLRFGPMSPKGLRDSSIDREIYAVVQLRKENKQGSAYNMVGFQTKMAYSEQKRIFSMIPGLEEAEFLKLGSIHRNMYLHTPKSLAKNLSSLTDPDLFFAGQITGVEGYFESTCIGLLVAQFVNSKIKGLEPSMPPIKTALGSLLSAITEPKEHFQPTNINFGLMPPPEGVTLKGRRHRLQKRDAMIKQAKESFSQWQNSSESTKARYSFELLSKPITQQPLK